VAEYLLTQAPYLFGALIRRKVDAGEKLRTIIVFSYL